VAAPRSTIHFAPTVLYNGRIIPIPCQHYYFEECREGLAIHYANDQSSTGIHAMMTSHDIHVVRRSLRSFASPSLLYLQLQPD
jgi:hypothetical protein